MATLYPKDQTTKLNHFHVWFPGGIVIGGLIAFILGLAGLGWKAQFVGRVQYRDASGSAISASP